MAQIDKGAPAAPSFEEQMRAAEQEAGVPSDVEYYGEAFLPPEPDEAGRVPASRGPEDQVVEIVTDAPDPTTEIVAPPEQEPEEPVEEPEVAATADPLAETNKKLGQIINENAELRRQIEQFTQPQEPVYQQPAPLTGDIGWFDEMSDSDPGTAAGWALQNGQPHLYDRAVRSWYEQDPVAAGRFERQLEQAALMQNVQAQIAPQLQGAQQVANMQQMEAAMGAVVARHPDFGDVMQSASHEDVQSLFGSGPLVSVLESALQGDQAAKEQVFETIYSFKKAANADLLVQAAREQPAAAAEEAKSAKREAFVGSATTTTPDEVPVSEAERQALAWAEMRPGMKVGWTGRDSRPRLGR